MKRWLVGSSLLALGVLLGLGFGLHVANAQKLLGPMGEFLGIEQRYSNVFITGNEDTLKQFWHENYLGWPAGEDLPWDTEFAGETVDLWVKDHEGSLSQPMLEPIATRITGDSAVVHYVLEYIVDGEDGTQSHRKIRVAHFWTKTESGWKLLGESTATFEF